MAVTGVVLRPAGTAFKAVPVALLAVDKSAGAVGSTFGSLLIVLGAGISTEIGLEVGADSLTAEVVSNGTVSVLGAGKASCLSSFFANRFGAGWGSACTACGGAAAMVRVEKVRAVARLGFPVAPKTLGEASSTSTCTTNTSAAKPASHRQRTKPDEYV